MDLEVYNRIHRGKSAFYPQERGLIAIWGREAVQFLNGLITNDVAKLEDAASMLAAFPNAQGRLLAVVRIRRQGDRFFFETEKATHEKVYQNLYRFTFAGDFFVEDLSEQYRYFSLANAAPESESDGMIYFGDDVFIAKAIEPEFSDAVEISPEVFEVLRIEKGIPLYGVDMDETTIVPELGLDGLISYNKGCYIGQEIIARIYFRGHVAKQLRGLILSDSGVKPQDELKSVEGRNAGRITSVCFSPKLDRNIALGYVRYDYLANGTELTIGQTTATVKVLPFLS
jgi:folate-binding protein YgfZ